MEAEIQISQGDDVTEFTALREWLRGERALTGSVRFKESDAMPLLLEVLRTRDEP